MPVVGIDLGTTFSCVAVARGGKIEVIANERGNYITPSYVAFTDQERLVGDSARDGVAQNIENTVFQVKRMMGRSYNDETVKEDMKNWPFEVIDIDGKPNVKVMYKNKSMSFCPEEISSVVLSSMRKTAETYLGEEITDAVITVPAYFNDAQRSATKDAGTIAGLNVRKLINEPTAAAVAYELNKPSKNLQKILIFDLGGGTFDVTIATVKDRAIKVEVTGGNTHLGGEDFDNRMVEYFVKDIKKRHGISIDSNKRAKSKLRKACEHAKRILSSATQERVVVDALQDGFDFSAMITQAKFEDLNSDLFEEAIDLVKETLRDAKLSASQIDEVVLVGGSTRIPRIQKMLQSLFVGKKLQKTINPDQAVAIGAAAWAAKLSNNMSHGMDQFTISDVTPLSLGTDVRGRDMDVVIKRNTTFPTRKHSSYSTMSDNQTSMKFEIYEGERPAIKDNNLLGKFVIKGIPPEPRGVASVESTFEIDDNGILTVRAFQKKSGIENEIVIENNKGRLSQNDISRMKAEADVFKEEDDEYRAQSAARNKLEDFIYSAKREAKEMYAADDLKEIDKNRFVKKCSETLQWLERHENAAKYELEEMQEELENLCDKYSISY